ncbi:tRNA lysidine(34) synthetase TilS [Coleofasciculus sp.]|uniref:tRNA lysidine(34) synthetase TilS n=1 Tax=Coleofasciculus sp. TaxID=3100458 RepID=UPI0039F7EF32
MSKRSDWTPLHARIHQTLKTRQILAPSRHVLVAVSGGQDSLCLMKLLLDLQPKWKWQLAIAHCDHRWPADKGLADHIQQLAQGWAIPFYLEIAAQVTQSEGAARQWRYQALGKIAQTHGFQDVVTAHTQSDRAETVLYNLIRGTGVDGLQSLTWQRPLVPGVQLVRPLLEVTRGETGEFVDQQHLPVWLDAYNQDLRYARNRIRQEVLPYFKTHFNPQVETVVGHTAELLRADVEYLETAARSLREQAMVSTSENEPKTALKLNRLVLRQAHLALQRRAIRQFLAIVQSTAANFEQIEAITALINAPNRSGTSSFPGGASAQVQGDWIIWHDSQRE